MKTRQIPAVGKTSDQKRSREFMGSVMTIVGGACWGLSGCCGQFLFEHRGVEAPLAGGAEAAFCRPYADHQRLYFKSEK